MRKQHVDLYRKLALRRNLLGSYVPRSCYVPYCGDGDIAVELYKGSAILAVDRDPARVSCFASRLPSAVCIVGDVERRFEGGSWSPPFDLADFDAYSYPYEAFRLFWREAPKADRLVLFFTDGERQAVKRSQAFVLPDSTRHVGAPLAMRRSIYNKYLKGFCEPYVAAEIAPYKIVRVMGYLRRSMLYWGCVVAKDG